MEIIIEPDSNAAASLTAAIIARQLRAKPASVLGLATGRTMAEVYARLVQIHRESGLDFSSCRTFNLDEYVGLSGEDPHSYRYYMNQNLFSRVNIDLRHTHLPDGLARDLEAECAKYEQLIQDSGGIDLQLLGIGNNGHLGFNEPPATFQSRTCVKTLSPATRQQNAPLFEAPSQVPHRAITMGVGTILDCRHCVLLATGSGKAAIVAQTIEGPVTNMISATALRSHPRCTIILDAAAASRLKNPDQYHPLSGKTSGQ